MELEWIIPWWNILRENQELYIITFLHQGEAIGFCPFMKEKKNIYRSSVYRYPEASYMDSCLSPP